MFDIVDFVKDINWKDTDNVIGKVLKGTVKSLDRPLGAVEGALSNFPDFRDIWDDPSKFAGDYASMYEGAYEGFKNPNTYDTRDIGLVDKAISALPDKYERIAEIGAETALDPLTYLGGIGLVGKGRKLGPVGKLFLEPIAGTNAPLAKRLATEYAVNAGARLGGEAGAELTEGTPFQTAGTIGGGLLAGGLTARTLSAKNIEPQSVAKYNSMVEEQLHEGNIFEYLDSLDRTQKSNFTLLDMGGTFDTYEEAIEGVKNKIANKQLSTVANPTEKDLAYWVKETTPRPSQYDIEVSKLYAAEPETVEIDFNNTKFIERNVKPIPLNHAVKDPLLDNSHNEFTTRFYENEFRNSNNPLHQKVQEGLVNWVSKIGGKPATIIRGWFKTGSDEGQVLHNQGTNWRGWVNSLSPEQVATSPVIRDINGSRYVFLYRGEHNAMFKLPDGKVYRYIEGQSNSIEVLDSAGNSTIFTNAKDGQSYISDSGEVIYKDEIFKAEKITSPMFEKNQEVESYSTDPSIYSDSGMFAGDKKFINPETGLEETGKFILGRWVPVDDVIAPVGRNSQEHEFLVLNRDTVSDEAYERITGHAKDAPRQTQYTVTKQIEDTSLPKAELFKSVDNATNDNYLWKQGGIYYEATVRSDGTFTNPKTISKIAYDNPLDRVGISNSNIYIGMPDQLRFKQEKLTFPDEESALKAAGNEGQISQSISGGYSKDLAEIRNQDIPRKPGPITTGDGYEVDYSKSADDWKPVEFNDNQLKWSNGEVEYEIKQLPDGTWDGIPNTKVDTLYSSPTLKSIQETLNIEGYKPVKGVGDKLLDALLGNNTQQANIVNPIKKAKSVIKLKSTNKASNVLAFNITQPDIPTPSAQQVANNIQQLTTKQVVDGMLNTKGIDGRITTQLESLNTKQRAELADSIVSNLALKGPPEDVVRTVINGFNKAGKGDPNKLIRANNMLRGAWATGDGSWFGIQGLLSIPHMLVTGRLGDVADIVYTSMRTMGGNKEIFRKYVARTLENLPEGAPPLHVAVENGLHLSILKGNQDIDFNIVERLTGNRLQPDAAFAAAGDVARISEFYNTWRRYKNTPNLDLSELARAVNRGTGIAEKPFGGNLGSMALFAPRFFQSQLEVVTKAFIDGGIEGNLARRQLISLLGTGAALTFAANASRGHETEIRPWEPNFMRIRDVQGQDISVFGPWDSLAKLIINVGSGDVGYARTKFSPLFTVAANLLTHETFTGEPFPPTGSPPQIAGKLAKNLLLPFAWQDLGEGGVVGTALNFFGVKNSPLSNSEKIDTNMINLGLDPNDPLARRQFMVDHPNMKKLSSDKAKEIDEIRSKTADKAALNEQLVGSDEISLTDFRANRKIISRTNRNQIDVLTQGQEFKADTQQRRWIEGYFSLFDQASDPVTGDIVGSKFDPLEASWIDANGQGAYDYVQRYMGIGKNPIESQYLSDMKELDKLGYFDMKKYDDIIYASGLDDDQIEDYRTQVSNARNLNTDLADMDFEDAVFEVLGEELETEQLYAIADAGKEAYQNIATADLKNLYPHLFLWFNPKATWSMYNQMRSLTSDELELRAALSS